MIETLDLLLLELKIREQWYFTAREGGILLADGWDIVRGFAFSLWYSILWAE